MEPSQKRFIYCRKRMKNILVTGAGGFIGRELVQKLSQNKKNLILALDNNIRGSLRSIVKKDNVIIKKIDIKIKIN